MHKWRRFAELSPRERRTLLQAGVLLPLVAAGRHTMSLRRLQAWLGRALPLGGKFTRDTAMEVIEARRVARLVQIAANYGVFHPNCLERSLVLWTLLRHRGINGDLRLGMRTQDEHFVAHAWVECNRVVLNDRDDIGDQFVIVEWRQAVHAREPSRDLAEY
jgi:hypothetical protein